MKECGRDLEQHERLLCHLVNWWQARTVDLHCNEAMIARPTVDHKAVLDASFLQHKSRE